MANHKQGPPIFASLPIQYQTEMLSRRAVLRLLGALSVTVAGSTRFGAVTAQEATPAATPQLGPQPDGTRLWRVQVAAGSMEDEIELMSFFPAKITINAGDAIYFDFGYGMPEIPHTVSFLDGQPVPDFAIPDPDAAVQTGDATPAGDPTRLIINPAVAFPTGGDTVDGTEVVNSGLDILLEPASFFTLTFPTPGTYYYQDLVFPDAVKGTVIVEEVDGDLPHEQADYDRMVAEEVTRLLDEGRALIDEHAEAFTVQRNDGTTLWEIKAGLTSGQIELGRFLPQELEIKVGDSVRWTTEATTLELHSATFGGGEEVPELLLIEPQEEGPPKLVLNPEFVNPAGGSVYRGEGFANTRFLSTRFPFPPSGDLTFEEPGEHHYFCAIHGTPTSGMRGKIIVS